MVEITKYVNDALQQSRVVEGICVVYCPHTTAGVTINENADPDVVRDFMFALDELVPDRAEFRHMEGNSAAHIKASLMGSSATVPIANSQLELDVWQGIYFCEFDGPRSRRFSVSIVDTCMELQRDAAAAAVDGKTALPLK